MRTERARSTRNPRAFATPATRGAALMLALWISGCAAPVPRQAPELIGDALRTGYLRDVEARRQAMTVEGDALVWSEWRGQKLPGVSARIYLEAPDACRLRVRGALGLALEVGAWGDSLAAWIPSERAAVALDVRADSIAFREPGARAWVALVSGWKPPADAWSHEVASDSGRVIRWSEHGDAVTLTLDRSGRPAVLRVVPNDRAQPLTVRYSSWLEHAGTPWPERVEAALDDGSLKLRIRMERWTFPAATRARVVIPADARWLTREEISDWWQAWSGE